MPHFRTKYPDTQAIEIGRLWFCPEKGRFQERNVGHHPYGNYSLWPAAKAVLHRTMGFRYIVLVPSGATTMAWFWTTMTGNIMSTVNLREAAKAALAKGSSSNDKESENSDSSRADRDSKEVKTQNK